MVFLYLVILLLATFFCIGFVLFLLAEFLAIFTTDAPFVPIPKDTEDEIIKNLGLNSGNVLYDLGCGDARILIRTLEKYPDLKAVGIEIAFWPYLLAKFKTRKYKNIEIKRENIFKTDISRATHIFLYLYPKVISRLFARIREQCRSGTTVMSCDFELDGVTPTKVVNLKNPSSRRGKKLFIYSI